MEILWTWVVRAHLSQTAKGGAPSSSVVGCRSSDRRAQAGMSVSQGKTRTLNTAGCGTRRFKIASLNQDEERSLRINASRRGRSSASTAVNFSANPRPGSARRTMVSALICPSWTRNSSLAVEPTPIDRCVSRNRPPRLIFRTRETSSRPAQHHSTHTPSCVSTRELSRLEGKWDCCTICDHHLRAFRDGGMGKYAGSQGRETL